MPLRKLPDSPATKEQMGMSAFGVLVAVGAATTSGAANSAALILHGAVNPEGNAYPAANLRLLAWPNSNAGQVYQSAAPSATQIDVRSATASIPYLWFLFLTN